MALVTIPPNEVTLIASAANNFRAENLSPKTIRIRYDTEEPADVGTDWGTLPTGNVEIRIVDGDLYGWSATGAVVSVFESAIPA